MKTDSLFYELFRLHPASLFELAGLEAEGEYIFESITVKSTEKRMDGFFTTVPNPHEHIANLNHSWKPPIII